MSRPAITEVSPTVAPKPKAGRAAKDGAGNARRGRRAVPDRSMPDCQLPGPSTVSEQVKAEAETKGQRRTAARKISATVHDPLPTEPKESIADRFPPALVAPCIMAGCPIGGTVLDPFGGAGTTGLVADRLQRDAILIELNPEYAELARRRIEGDSSLFAQVEAA